MEGKLVKGQIGVIAGGGPLASGTMCSPEVYKIASDVGREIARNGFALVCGGLGGVMSEVALWPKIGKPLVGIKTWELEGRVPQAERGGEAVVMLLGMLG
jgi:predicted Rossmann-fold nucleotide-binding protein